MDLLHFRDLPDDIVPLLLVLFGETKYVPISVRSRTTETPGIEAIASKLHWTKCDAAAARSANEMRTFETHGIKVIEQAEQSTSLPNTYRQRMRLSSTTEEPLVYSYIAPFKMALFPHELFSAIQCANAMAFLVQLKSFKSIVFAAPPYNFNTAGAGLMLIGPLVGNMIGTLYGGIFGDCVVVRLARKKRDIFEPEMRLYVLLLPALIMGARMVIFGAMADLVSLYQTA
ncbi:hypothetical protein CFIO01_00369 [Colletotrichum fioriniae PJ7]|uniref:Major facilitator superfamily transporter n=1 Tax=Colletotrichum fioriniae PJ7 TaxID=1445577 RepID=A0A010RDP1_9PEZI|nr:hypothetical protein CFIO01_00369 [Colletotrichum fioriniae PJ7]